MWAPREMRVGFTIWSRDAKHWSSYTRLYCHTTRTAASDSLLPWPGCEPKQRRSKKDQVKKEAWNFELLELVFSCDLRLSSAGRRWEMPARPGRQCWAAEAPLIEAGEFGGGGSSI